MKYKFEIKNDMDQNELDEGLKENYRFPLLNFAFVIADALAERSPFSSKFYFGKTLSDLRAAREELKKIKSEVTNLLENCSLKYGDDKLISSLKKLNFEKRKLLIISYFELKSFFDNIDRKIKSLEEIIDLRKIHPGPHLAFWPYFKKHKRSFGISNQISFIWAPFIRDNNGIHWRNICNLISWFQEYLEGSTYVSKLYFHKKNEIAGYPKVLKNQYWRIKELFRYPIEVSAGIFYFPYKDNKPGKPSFAIGPVCSVKFYENKIKTIYKVGERLNYFQTIFESKKPISELRKYNQDSEERENELLLVIE